jgi:hypothetical protein
MEKKNLLVNCELCDTRKMKEEDYAHFEQITINTDVILVSERSKNILNRLPILLNQDKMLELPEEMSVTVNSVNGSYEITGDTLVGEHTLLTVNGELSIRPGAEEVFEKYEQIEVNGSVTCPKSMSGYLGKMSVNGSITTYPDECILLKSTFVLDKYFPLRAKENASYYVKKCVTIKDEKTEIRRLIDKNVRFITETVILPEKKVEECACVFDDAAEFVVVPEGMKLVTGDVILDEKLLRKEGTRLFVYGNLEVGKRADMNRIAESIEKLIVKGTVSLHEEQADLFAQIDAEYEKLEILDNRQTIANVLRARIDRTLLENCAEGIRVRNAARVVLEKDVETDLILKKLRLENCMEVLCPPEQESAVAAVSQNVARIGQEKSGEGGTGNIPGMLKSMADTKIINADEYMM